MSEINIGNRLNQITTRIKHALFTQGELAQLTHNAFDFVVSNIQTDITLSYPVGYNPDKTLILSERTYKKEDLIKKYSYLAYDQLPINGIYQLVTLIESLLSEVLRSVILKHPKKIGAKKTIAIGALLDLSSIEEIHIRAVDTIVNELAYKSPKEYAEELNKIIGLNFLECPAYLKYLELKATRDIFIHNQGIANDTYLSKSGSHSRVKKNQYLPVTTQYFLESYETCLQLVEWSEENLHEIWFSSEYDERINTNKESSAAKKTVVKKKNAVKKKAPKSGKG